MIKKMSVLIEIVFLLIVFHLGIFGLIIHDNKDYINKIGSGIIAIASGVGILLLFYWGYIII